MIKLSKASERLEKAKQKYKTGETVTDNVLLKLAASSYTLGILVVILVALLVAWLI